MKQSLNRRTVLAAAAAIPAVAMPALALASGSGPDPVFAAIKTHKAAYAAYIRASHAESRVQDPVDKAQFAGTIRKRPSALVAWRTYSHIGGGEIESARDEFLAAGIDPERIEREYRQVRANYEALENAEAEWEREVGLAPHRVACREAFGIERDAVLVLATAVPSTVAGALALLAYIEDFNFGVYGRVGDGWYSVSDHWPVELIDDDAPLNHYGKPVAMSFEFAVLRNVRAALANLAA